MEEMKKWVVEINEELKRMGYGGTEMVKWKKHSIYKLPTRVTELNRKAFCPQTVSFGPYHRKDDQLKGMKEHKRRALLHFLKRCGKPIESLVHRMDQIVQDLYDSYEPLDPFWRENTPRFLKLMILDGCFMLEIMRFDTRTAPYDGYGADDPLFSNHGRLYIIPYIKRDMFVLENQLPMMLLETLIEFESNTTTQTQQVDKLLNKLILQFFSSDLSSVERIGKCVHALDVYRESLVGNKKGGTPTPSTPTPTWRRKKDKIRSNQVRSVTELSEAGISFKNSKSSRITDVSFKGGVLELPVVDVDDSTDTRFLNLIAFERFHVGAGNEVTAFVFFMDSIINHERDVALLHAKGIIRNGIGSDKAVADLFNSLSRETAVDRGSTIEVEVEKIIYYYRKPWNKWRANLFETYCRNPWVLISVLAAIFLFGLTIVQTVYSVLSYHKESSAPTPRPHPVIPRIPPGHH